MSAADRWRLTLTIEGASEDDLSRGIAAAKQVFESEGAIPFEAASAIFKRDGEIDPLTEREDWLVSIWNDAERAAYQAATGKPIPHEGPLELLPIN